MGGEAGRDGHSPIACVWDASVPEGCNGKGVSNGWRRCERRKERTLPTLNRRKEKGNYKLGPREDHPDHCDPFKESN